MPATTTIKGISMLSGCSISTVSKALNNKMDVSEETRIRIQELAKCLNYVPNNTAVALRKKTNKTIAIMVPYLCDKPFTKLVSCFQNRSFEEGYKLLVFQSFDSREKVEESINYINDGTVDGVIMVALKPQLNDLFLKISVPSARISLASIGSEKTTHQLCSRHFDQLILNIADQNR